MHRLFVAIRPPRAIREALLDLMHGIAGARWQQDVQLHLTLRFIGDCNRHRAADILAALGSIHQSRFAIALDGVGSFVARGKGTLWAGVSPRDQLNAMHKKVDQACARVGIAPDARAYHPHITLARLPSSAGPIDALVQRCGGLSTSTFAVESFSLFESQLNQDGAHYRVVERYPLD